MSYVHNAYRVKAANESLFDGILRQVHPSQTPVQHTEPTAIAIVAYSSAE
jgi:hypothetical protein